MRALLPIGFLLSLAIAAGSWWIVTRRESETSRSAPVPTPNQHVEEVARPSSESPTDSRAKRTEAKRSLEQLLTVRATGQADRDDLAEEMARAARDREDGVTVLLDALHRLWAEDPERIPAVALALGILRGTAALDGLKSFVDQIRENDVVPASVIAAIGGRGDGAVEPELRDWLLQFLRDQVEAWGQRERNVHKPYVGPAWMNAAQALARGDVPIGELRRYLAFTENLGDHPATDILKNSLAHTGGPRVSRWASTALGKRQWRSPLELELAVRLALHDLESAAAAVIDAVLSQNGRDEERKAVLSGLKARRTESRHVGRFLPSLRRLALGPAPPQLQAPAMEYYAYVALTRGREPTAALPIVRAAIRSPGVPVPVVAVHALDPGELVTLRGLLVDPEQKRAAEVIRLLPSSRTAKLTTKWIRQFMVFVAEHSTTGQEARAAARRWLTWMDELKALGKN